MTNLSFLHQTEEERLVASYPPEIQRQYWLDDMADQYRGDLFKLAKFGLNYSQMTELTHKPITDMLMSPTKKKLLVIPRGCFKSSIASISFPIWLLINDPNRRILIDSELYTNSSRFIREIRGHLESKHMKELFGSFVGPTWTESEIIIKQRTKVYKEASITASGIGAQKTSQHYDYIIADDLSSIDNSMTEDQREKVYDHYRLYISLLEPGGTIVVIGTRFSHGDIIQYILDNEINPEQKKGLIA
jgi:hypothetical protein